MHHTPTIHTHSRHAPRILVAASIAIGAMAFAARSANAQACLPEDCLPPANSAYSGSANHHFAGIGVTADFSNLSLHGFSSCSGVPASVPNTSTTSSFTATMDYSFSLNGGAPTIGQSPANATIRVTFNHLLAPTRFFDTEMLQLDIAGLPFAAMVRESPVLASSGQTMIQDQGGGMFKIDSFFDVFFELSIDGGATWIPESSGPGHLSLTGPGCPTPNRRTTWGQLKIIYR
jgi:hypothetical protein